jgi:hypothetical protein
MAGFYDRHFALADIQQKHFFHILCFHHQYHQHCPPTHWDFPAARPCNSDLTRRHNCPAYQRRFHHHLPRKCGRTDL